MTEMIECQRRKTNACESAHQREKLVCAATPAVHKDNGWTAAGGVGMNFTVVVLISDCSNPRGNRIGLLLVFGGMNSRVSIWVLAHPGAILPSRRVVLLETNEDKPPDFLGLDVNSVSDMHTSSVLEHNSTGKCSQGDYRSG